MMKMTMDYDEDDVVEDDDDDDWWWWAMKIDECKVDDVW